LGTPARKVVNGIALARGMCWRKELPCNSANKFEKLLSLSAASAASKTLTLPIMRSDLAAHVTTPGVKAL